MKLLIELPEGGLMPHGYGLAWRRWDRLTAVCAPMPLHLILRVARDAYFRFMWLWWPARWERLLIEAHLRGKSEGKELAERLEHARRQDEAAKWDALVRRFGPSNEDGGASK